MSQNHGRGRTGDQFEEKIVIVRGALNAAGLTTNTVVPPRRMV
jgi:hypothetical protein